MGPTNETAEQTLAMLEDRLRRVDFFINGDDTTSSTAAPTANTAAASTRLRNLERSLQTLANRSDVVYDVLQLQQQIPELFHAAASPNSVPTTLPPVSLAQLILAHHQLYKTSATQLQALKDTREIPDSTALARLVAMQPRIDALYAKQVAQAREYAELRARSARLVEHWYESGVLDMGERWADWEERLRGCEILVRRSEGVKKREEGAV